MLVAAVMSSVNRLRRRNLASLDNVACRSHGSETGANHRLQQVAVDTNPIMVLYGGGDSVGNCAVWHKAVHGQDAEIGRLASRGGDGQY